MILPDAASVSSLSDVSIEYTMLSIFEPLLDIPVVYYGALLGVGFCIYYLFEVVKVST